MLRENHRKYTLPLIVLLNVVVLSVYWRVLDNGFVKYDDPDYVYENPHIVSGLTTSNIEWAFRTGHGGNWHPLTWISHMSDVQFFGLEPKWHHLVSLLLHVANTVLVFLVLGSATGCLWPSIAVAALFALHPLHVESVAWASERKDVLSTFFGLLCILLYVKYCNSTRPLQQQAGVIKNAPAAPPSSIANYLLALIFLALGLMSKSMLVTMPCILLLLDFWPLRRVSILGQNAGANSVGKILFEKLPFFLLAATACVVTYLVQREAGALSSLEALPLDFRISNAIISYVRYIAKTLWPVDLAVFYPHPQEWPGEVVLGAVILLLGISALSIWLAKKSPYVAVGWFWFLGTLVPVIGLVQVGRQSMADRYSYLPLIGLFLAASWAVAELPKQLPAARVWVGAAGLAVLGACAALSWQQLGFWKDNRTLFSHAIAVTKDNAVAHNNLGVSLLETGERMDAAAHFTEAVRIKPSYSEALVNLGLCREKEGRADEAIEFFEKALRGQATPSAHYNLANLLSKKGKLDDAQSHYLEAIKLDPEFVEAMYNLGILQASRSQYNEAVNSYLSVLKLKPGYLDARLNLGAVLFSAGQVDEAIAQFRVAAQMAPQNPDVQFNLASALNAKGDFAQASIAYAEACRLRPDDAAAREGLGLALMYQGKPAEASPQFQELLRVRPDGAAHHEMAMALDAQGQIEQAIVHYREAIRLAPNAPIFLNDLAWILATNPNPAVRNAEQAVALAEKACQLSGGKEPRFWGTLDAGYAGAGRFEEAVVTANKARELALAAGQKDIAQSAEARLALYRSHKPYHSQPITGAQP